MKKKLEELVQKNKEDMVVENEGNLIDQRGNITLVKGFSREIEMVSITINTYLKCT